VSYCHDILVGFGAAARRARGGILLRFFLKSTKYPHLAVCSKWRKCSVYKLNHPSIFCGGNCVDKLSRERRKNRRARVGIGLPFSRNSLNIRIWQLAINAANIR
jgi:hypothetical protein